MLTRAFTLFASTALLASTAAYGEQPKPGKGSKQDEKICETIEMIGSRLSTKRICATRAEWAERRKQDRDAVEQAQTRMNGPCSVINSHTAAPSC